MRSQMFLATALAASVVCNLVAEPAVAQSFRVEAHGGWDRVTNVLREDGLLYGVGVGLDFRLSPRVTAGLEANFDLSNVEQCKAGAIKPTDKLCVTAKRDLSAVARLGYNVGPNTQVYGLAGYSNARFEVDYKPPTGAQSRLSGNSDGLRLGAGFQQNLGSSVYSKLEYRYSNYEAGAERHQVVAGLGVAF